MNETPHGNFVARVGAKILEVFAGKKAEIAEAPSGDKTVAAPKAEIGPPLVALFTGLFDASKAAGRFFKDSRGTVYQYRANGMIVRAIRKNSKERRRRSLRDLCKRYARPGKPVHRLMHEARTFKPEMPTGVQPEDRAA